MSGPLILIVEDNEKNLKLIRDYLQFKGYVTIEAGTGEAGIVLAREQQPSIILMDVQLPGIDGMQAMKSLKSDPVTQQIPIIALTSFAMSGDQEQFIKEGFDDYISKPINIKEIPEIVNKYIGDVS
jgi:two-component system cell cycle response regulator DivK